MNRKLYSGDSWQFITPDRFPILLTFHSNNFDPTKSGLEFNAKNEAKIELGVGGNHLPVKLAKIGHGLWCCTHYKHSNGNEIVREQVEKETGDNLFRATSMDNRKRNFVPPFYRHHPQIDLYSMINDDLPKILFNQIQEVRDLIEAGLTLRFGGAGFIHKWSSIKDVEMSYDAPTPAGEELTQSDFFRQCISTYTRRLKSGYYDLEGRLTPILDNTQNDEHPDAPGLATISGYFKDRSEFSSYTKYIPPPNYTDMTGSHRMEFRPTKQVIKRICGGTSFDSAVKLKTMIHALRDAWDDILTEAFNTNYPWNDDIKKARLRAYLQNIAPKNVDYLYQQILNNRPLSKRDKHVSAGMVDREREKGFLYKEGHAALWLFNWDKLM